jgi:hypothetical protein
LQVFIIFAKFQKIFLSFKKQLRATIRYVQSQTHQKNFAFVAPIAYVINEIQTAQKFLGEIMRDLLFELQRWRERGEAAALATVVKTWGSSPRPAGAKMAVNARGEMIGSVSGGCVENAVIEAALQVIQTGKPKLLTFGVSNEQAWEVGLACGGTIEVFVEKLTSEE